MTNLTLKKLLTLMLALCMSAACLTACGDSDESDSSKNTTTASDSQTVSEVDDDKTETDINSDEASSNEYDDENITSEDEPLSEEKALQYRISDYYSATLQYPSQNDEWKYNVYDCYIEITGYLGEAKEELIIPDEIDGLPVWSYNPGYDFGDNKTVTTSVKFPKELLIIGKNAFQGYRALESIELPEGLIKIEARAFDSCDSLNGNITLPASVQTVGELAFNVIYPDRQYIELTVLNPECSFDHYLRISAINGYAGSTAAQFAADKNIPFKLIED